MRCFARALGWVVGLLLAPYAVAEEIGAGTLSLAEPAHSAGGGPIVFSLGFGSTCADILYSCDTYDLTVDIPEDTLEFFPDAFVTIVLYEVDNPGIADDSNLHVFDERGNAVGASLTYTSDEILNFPVANGTHEYLVGIAHAMVVAGSYGLEFSLNLGAPSELKSDTELFAWFEENQAAAELQAPARSAQNVAGGALGFWMLFGLGMISLRRRGLSPWHALKPPSQ